MLRQNVNLGLRIADEKKQKLLTIAEFQKKTLAELVRKLIDDYISYYEKLNKIQGE